MKKLVLIILMLIVNSIFIMPVMAENEDFENNETYYIQMCKATELSEEDQAICEDFQIYMIEQSAELQKTKDDIDAQIENIRDNIAEEAEKIREYEEQIAELNIQIDELDNRIEDLSNQIEEKIKEIDANQKEVDYLQQKLKDRMVSEQPTMRLNVMIDFLMGASSFEDFLRRASGLNAINTYEEQVRLDLVDLLEQLEAARQELAQNQLELEEDKQELVDTYNEVLALEYKANIVKEEFLKLEAQLVAEMENVQADLESITDILKDINYSDVISSSGFMRPVKESESRISAGTWHYPSYFKTGAVHFGVDYAASKGVNVYAPANGVIVARGDGCGDGYLGNRCGTPVSYGGNQIFMIVSVDGRTYGLKFYHLLYGTVAEAGAVVQGEKIGETGTSGNSTGPHTHVEVIYLGDMSVEEYISNWSGSLNFGVSTTRVEGQFQKYLCENNPVAPCRLRPEIAFGDISGTSIDDILD